MNARYALVALAALSGFGGAAQAEVYAVGPVYGGPLAVGGYVSCRVFNYGTQTATLTERRIYANTNAYATPSSDTCNIPLKPNYYCAFTAPIKGNLAYSCRVVAVGSDVRLSGVGEIQGPDFSVLNSLPFTK